MQIPKPISQRALLATLAIAMAVFVPGLVTIPSLSPTLPTKLPISSLPESASDQAPLANPTRVTDPRASLASATTNTPSNFSFEEEHDLPTSPHPQYEYHALVSAPSGQPYSSDTAFLNRISAPTGWAEATANGTSSTTITVQWPERPTLTAQPSSTVR
jgi:hypothetical protein